MDRTGLKRIVGTDRLGAEEYVGKGWAGKVRPEESVRRGPERTVMGWLVGMERAGKVRVSKSA